jgi:hypothetical protein
MQLLVDSRGAVRCIYSEVIDLAVLGRPLMTRASRVEPDSHGHWRADLTLVGGPILGPFLRRSEALGAETAWLEANWLKPVAS